MNRIRNLTLYQKVILLLLAVMTAGFTIVYSVVSSQVGFEYNGVILRPHEENGSIVYSGRMNRQPVSFTVTEDKTVTYRYGDNIYGPYTTHEDPSAVPENPDMAEMAQHMTGVEIRSDGEVFFRGGILMTGGQGGQAPEMMLFNESGGLADTQYAVFSSHDGKTEYDMEGSVIDQQTPSKTAILTLMSDPELTSKGDWAAWFCGIFLSVLTAILILYADELFRWNLSFQIRNTEKAEPSDWEIARRCIAWTALPVMALIAYISGLTM